jgi:D-3-phosphoglycerate dehydrogenase / 2-oxoglutarate reductase
LIIVLPKISWLDYNSLMPQNIENFEAVITMSITNAHLVRLKSRCLVYQCGWGLTRYRLSEDELCDVVRSTDILLVGYEKITEKVIQSAKNLKLIGVSRGNPINVNLDAINERKIPLLFTPGRNAIAAAEFTIGLMLSQARNIAKSDRSLRDGSCLGEPLQDIYRKNPEVDVIWDIDGESPYNQLRGIELCGRTLGLIGLGNVATRVALLAKAFGMHVITFTPDGDMVRAKDLGIKIVPLDQVFSESDFISVHCSVTSKTNSIIDNAAFEKMKPTTFLINTARASMIDQKALVNALQKHQIAGAALDVFWYEPLPKNHPLLKMNNVILTPHLAGSTNETPERHSRILVDDVFAWMDGISPKFVFNKEALTT